MGDSKNRFSRIFLSVLVLVSGCASVSGGSTELSWEAAAAGIEYGEFSDGAARCSMVRIDLSQAGLELCAYPDEGTELSLEGRLTAFDGKKTKAFASERNACVAINTVPFRNYDSGKKTLAGTHVWGGREYGIPVNRYSALAIYKDEGGLSARIFSDQTEIKNSGAEPYMVAGGFFTILRNGISLAPDSDKADGKCAAGISADGRTLYILSSEKTLFRDGMTAGQCARVFASLGCTDAMEFDGGSSVALFTRKEGRLVQKNSSPFIFQAASIGFSLTNK